MAKKFWEPMKDINPLILEAQQMANKIEKKKITPRHIILKYRETKTENLKSNYKKKRLSSKE